MPIIKDLDADILAKVDDYSTNLAHRAASIVIKRARGQEDCMIKWTNVVSTLKPRYTSWTRDRLIIASLMANVSNFRSNLPKWDMTKAILLQSKDILQTALLHGKPTYSNIGPWSWCPISILDLENEIVGDPLKIDKSGAVTGRWCCMPLDRAHIHQLVQSHRSVELRIEAALHNKEKCLLLARGEVKPSTRRRCLLVMNLGSPLLGEIRVRHCQYIGTVVANYRGKGFVDEICMGCEEEEGWLNKGTQGSDYGGWTPLHFAAREGDATDVRELLQQGVDVNAKDDIGRTALHWAQKHCNEDVIKLLGEEVDMNAKNPEEICYDRNTDDEHHETDDETDQTCPGSVSLTSVWTAEQGFQEVT
jgi:hypothetical protein